LWELTKKILKNLCIEYPLLSNLRPGKITRAHDMQQLSLKYI
jgi:hypothetical protein